ncbi:MAG: STAS domain-containing protein [Gaiellales bacterium]
MHREGDVRVVTLTGEHDVAVLAELESTLDSALRAEDPVAPHTLVLIDLTDARFFDSTIVAALLRAHDTAENMEGTRLAIVVESPDQFAARMLRLVGVTRIIPTYVDRDAAIQALTRQGTAEGELTS